MGPWVRESYCLGAYRLQILAYGRIHLGDSREADRRLSLRLERD